MDKIKRQFIVEITPEVLSALLMENGLAFEVEKGIPRDSKLLDIKYDISRNGNYIFRFESENFGETNTLNFNPADYGSLKDALPSLPVIIKKMARIVELPNENN